MSIIFFAYINKTISSQCAHVRKGRITLCTCIYFYPSIIINISQFFKVLLILWMWMFSIDISTLRRSLPTLMKEKSPRMVWFCSLLVARNVRTNYYICVRILHFLVLSGKDLIHPPHMSHTHFFIKHSKL